ncbi:DUF2971 domain-containing protein [Stappia sp. GBMRC 2046]|uniref:DUF2971 domain-containing protein n=1 Tax=Stappia sediminis TaxID=2692190 RepID=A0A7X3LRC0_9HYPH|nr:DUF2971 domain-containing protein [Stappia sediminis]MXN63669.1 DUF2971 domain-containing protein [Stappia sediminis]
MLKKKILQNLDGSYVIENQKYRNGFLVAFFGTTELEGEVETNIQRLRFRRENSSLFKGKLFHYTTISGFKGIIDSAGFWASDNRFMNDTEEVRHGSELIRKILQRREKNEKTEDFKYILRQVQENLPHPNENTNLVACFSLVRDSLEQWRGYAPSGGICIGLSTEERADDVKPLIMMPQLSLYKVRYRYHAKLVHILSVIRRYREQYKLDRELVDRWPEYQDEEYVRYLSLELSNVSLLFKNEAFTSEQEVRYLIPLDKADQFEGGLQFRESSVGLIPYVNTGSYTGALKRLPISEVIVGPSPHQSLIAESVKTFLEVKGYSQIDVKFSNVPFRSL